MLSQIIRERDISIGGLGPTDGQRLRVSEVWARYLDAQRNMQRSSGHLRNLETAWRRFEGTFDETRVFALKTEDVVRFRASWVAAGTSHRTANAQCDALRAALKWAAESGLILSNPLASLRALPENDATKRKVRRALTATEIQAVLSASKRHDEKRAFPLTPLWRFIVATGCRWSEAARLLWSDVDTAAGLVTLRGKGGRIDAIPFDATVLADLPRKDGMVFRSADGRPLSTDHGSARLCLRRAMIAAGVARTDDRGRWADPSLDIHALRTARATNLVSAGVAPALVSALLRHRSPRVTLGHYSRLRLEDLRKVIDAEKV